MNNHSKSNLSDLLESYAATVTGDRIFLKDIICRLGNRSFGGLLLIFALPIALPVPAPGIATLFGVPLVLISAQLALGKHQIWLPNWLMNRSLSHTNFSKVLNSLLPMLRRLEKILRPRALWLCNRWTTIIAGFISFVLALIIALPIPFGQVVPGFAITFFAFGLIERDGLALIAGLLTTLLAIGVVIAAMSGLNYLFR